MLNRIFYRNLRIIKTWTKINKNGNVIPLCGKYVNPLHTQSPGTDVSNKSEPTLRDFIPKSVKSDKKEFESTVEEVPYLDQSMLKGDGLGVYLEVFGCQMNVSDAEIVWAILQGAGYSKVDSISNADIVLFVTCAIRENAEQKIWSRVKELRSLKNHKTAHGYPMKIGILGCMAERLKEKVIEKEKLIDLVAGPDSYRDLPRLLALTRSDQKAVNVLLSLDETYADVMPVRLNTDSVTSYLSIMRGCDNMCTYCIVPFTRGKERSRAIDSILDEVRYLSDQGIKEITLLGQNVNSYRDASSETRHVSSDANNTTTAKGFKTVYKAKKGGIRFAELLDRVSDVNPEIRIRFTSPHPKDFADDVIEVIRDKHNICKCIHLPIQSGNNEILERMRRGYTREAYLELVQRIREAIPEVTFTSDFIVGFCGETEEQFQDTVSILNEVMYHVAYTYAYSMREKTTAHRRYEDTVPRDVKHQRVSILGTLSREIAQKLNENEIGNEFVILIEGDSRKSESQYYGRTDGNIKVLIPKCEIPSHFASTSLEPISPGDYVTVKITEATSQTMKGIPLYHTTLSGDLPSMRYLPHENILTSF